jgi:hypothetical protein
LRHLRDEGGKRLVSGNLWVYLKGNVSSPTPAGMKGFSMSGINDYIDSEVKANDVVLFMKGTPGFPQCGFSGQVVQILDYIGALTTSGPTTRASTC